MASFAAAAFSESAFATTAWDFDSVGPVVPVRAETYPIGFGGAASRGQQKKEARRKDDEIVIQLYLAMVQDAARAAVLELLKP